MRLDTSDIVRSKNAALIDQGWIFGEMMNRIGDPFSWVDGDRLDHIGGFSGTVSVLQYLAMSGEIYDTPEAIRCKDFRDVHEMIKGKLTEAVASLVPFRTAIDLERYISSTASVKAQDYGAIRTWAPDLPTHSVHVDIGPGLGANAIYSLHGLGASYGSFEAHPVSYEVQRRFFRVIAGSELHYLDPIDCENFGLSGEGVAREIAAVDRYRIRHLPSWHAPLIPPASVDLVTATWVLNEVTPAGIIWLLHHVRRMLRIGGYFYVRDSGLRKPLRHDLDYDRQVLAMGFESAGHLNIRNRIDMHGIPRIFRKTADSTQSFEDCYDAAFGRFAVTSHGGAFNQNVKNPPPRS